MTRIHCRTANAVWLALAVLTASAGAAGQAQAPAPASSAPQSAPQANATLRPGDDFFAWANGDWLAKTQIPADRGSWGAMASLAEETNGRIVKLIEDTAADKKAAGDARKVADYYTAYMDEASIEAKGTAPLKPVLARIAAIHIR